VASVPGEGGIVRLDAPERLERDGAERNDGGRAHEPELLGEEAAAGIDLARRRASVAIVGAERVAEHGVGHEDALARQAGGGEERFEAAPGAVGGEGDAGAGGAQPARRLRNEEHGGVKRAVRAREDMAVVHAFTSKAASRARG
jgi:hypothetical protein